MDNIIHYYTIQVIAIPVEDCESFRDCTSCSGLGDPLCGWCSIEDKCSRRSECSNNNETRRWIQSRTMCIVNFAISPTTHPVEVTNQQVYVIEILTYIYIINMYATYILYVRTCIILCKKPIGIGGRLAVYYPHQILCPYVRTSLMHDASSIWNS